jgi:hypothetical protein
LRDAPPLVFGHGRACLASALIGFFNSALQPHLDQMQHTPIDDAPRERQHQLGVWNAAKVIRQVGVYHVRVATE